MIGTAYPEGERRLGKPPGSVRQVNADVRLIEENLVKEDKLRRVSERAAQKSKSEKLSLKRREREQRKALSELARAADEERGGLVAPDERIDALKNAYEKIYPSADFDEDLGGVVEVRRDADAVGANRGLTPEQVTNMSGTPEQVLTYLQSVMQSPLGRIVAGQIKQLGLDLPAIEWGPIASNTPGSSAPVMGRYRSTRRSDRPGIQHKIMVDPARADLETVLHEFVHAATMRLLEQPETPAHVQVRNQLQALMEYSQDQSAELASQYGFTNVLEFVAEALSNPEFQRTLAKIPLPYTPRVSVFDAIKRLILRLFGVTNENNVLSEVFGLSKAVMSGKQISVEDAANAEAAPRAVPSTAILGTTNGARTQIAYQGRNGAYTIYTVTPQNYRGDPATKEAGLTRTQVEQRIRDAGAQVVSPAADTRPAPGTPKNTSTKLVGYGTDGALKAAAFEQKDGTWTYYESTGDVRTDPDARVVKGLSKDAAQRYIAAKGYSPEPPAGGVRPHGDTPTAVGYDPASAFRVSFQDTEAALKNFNRNLPVDQRVDIAATLRNSRAMARIKQVMKQYVEPARKAGEEITQRFGKTQEQVENTLAQLHIAERMNNKIRQIQRGNMDASRQAAAIADVTRKGNAAAAEIARERGSNPAYVQAVQQQLATAVKALSDNTIDLSAQYGLISRQTAENIKAAYDYYVPLQIGEKTTTGKAATGQNVQTDRSFARMVEQMMRTISRGEMNRIRGVIFDAAERSGVTRNDTGENVVHIGTTPVIRYDPITNSLNDGTDSHIFDPNSVDFYREGSRYRMTISEPSLLEALHPYKGEERKTAIDALVGTLAFVNHTIAIGKTALSPIFGPFNMLRDMGTAMVNLPEGVSRVQLTKQLMNPETYIAAAQGTLQDAWGTDQTGRFGQAATAGALVSQRAYLGLDQTARDIETQFNPSVVSKTKAKSDTLFKFLTAGSQFFESVTRYAVYKAALDSGLSQTEAAFAAKTASVNFEQRGLHNLSNYWIFGNAKIQSLNALRETFKRKGISPTTVSATAGMILLGAAAAAIGLRDSEKDKDGKSKYSKIPDYKKDSMILFREGAAGIPIPQEIAPFYVLGNALMEAKKLGGDKSGSEVASRIFTSALNQLWPGNVPQQDVAGHKARPAEFLMRVVLPSQAMPLVDIVTNRNTFGSPVVSGKDDKLKRGVPSHLMGSPDENQLAVNVAQGMYDVTGGLLDVAPQQLKLLNNYFNPATEGYAFIRDALGMRDAKYQGDIVNPLARKFTGVATQFYDQDQFDSLLAKATQAKYLATMNGINTLSPEDQVLARSADMLSKVNSDANNLFKGNKLLTKDRRALLNDRKQELLLDGIRRYNELRDRSVR